MRQITEMLQRTTDGAMLVNKDGNVILWNKAAERLLGFRSEDLIAHGKRCLTPLVFPYCLFNATHVASFF
jgi:PAS domain S-box-containing protein